MDPRYDRPPGDDHRGCVDEGLELPQQRQLTLSHDPGAFRERALTVAGACLGLAFTGIVINTVTGWLFPFASGWRWWVLAVSLLVLGAIELHGELKTEGHGRLRLSPPHFKDVILAVCVTVILLLGVLRL